MASGWALIEQGSRKIVAESKSKTEIVRKAQPIINRNPRKRYRYIRVNIDPEMPWFKKGE